MKTVEKNQQDDSRRGSRAIGAMFFSIFGGAWIVYWSLRALSGNIVAPVVIAAFTAAIFMLALNQYRRCKGAIEAEKESPLRRRTTRLFNLINAGQWVVIVIGANVLANVGLGEWIIPFVIFVIGLHFLPLARIFSNPPHYVTGAALIIVALAVPLFSGGPTDPIACLATGLILWTSAMWAIREAFSVHASESTADDS